MTSSTNVIIGEGDKYNFFLFGIWKYVVGQYFGKWDKNIEINSW